MNKERTHVAWVQKRDTGNGDVVQPPGKKQVDLTKKKEKSNA